VSDVVRPSGTVTFLFTDIEGSTRLWEVSPNAMRTAVERHDEILSLSDWGDRALFCVVAGAGIQDAPRQVLCMRHVEVPHGDEALRVLAAA